MQVAAPVDVLHDSMRGAEHAHEFQRRQVREPFARAFVWFAMVVRDLDVQELFAPNCQCFSKAQRVAAFSVMIPTNLRDDFSRQGLREPTRAGGSVHVGTLRDVSQVAGRVVYAVVVDVINDASVRTRSQPCRGNEAVDEFGRLGACSDPLDAQVA
jgi:hypothetical protein